MPNITQTKRSTEPDADVNVTLPILHETTIKPMHLALSTKKSTRKKRLQKAKINNNIVLRRATKLNWSHWTHN